MENGGSSGGGGGSNCQPLLPGQPSSPPPPLLCRQDEEEEEEKEEKGKGRGVDWLGRPLLASYGGWKAASSLLGSQALHSLATSGCTVNMVIFLVKEMREDTATAANAVTTWLGTSYLSSIAGGVLGDTSCGRLWASVFYLSVYVLGLVMFAMFGSTISAEAQPSSSQKTLFYAALYIMGLGTASLSPNLVSLGADQFDSPKQASFFFSVYVACINVGMLFSTGVLSYIENEGHWKLGFWISAGTGVLGFIVFLAGMPGTRQIKPGRNLLSGIANAICARNGDAYTIINPSVKGLQKDSSFRRLDEFPPSKANPCSRGVRSMIQLLPFCVCGIVVSAAVAQKSTLFVLQGYTMENRVWGNIKFPSASMGLFSLAVVAVGAPMYTMLIEPVISRERRGLSSIIRMGAGVVAAICMFCGAAIVEAWRLKIASEREVASFVDERGGGKIPMSMFWLIPQYVLEGLVTVLFTCGHMDFTYTYSPPKMRSLASAFSLLGFALGNYLSSFLIKLVTTFTSWIENDLNRGHLDYFYWLFASLLFLTFVFFLAASKWILSLPTSHSMKSSLTCDDENVGA